MFIRIIKFISLLGIILVSYNIIFSAITINLTPSYPVGIYLNKNITTGISRNKYYTFCPAYNEYMKFAEQHGFWMNIDKSCGDTIKYLKKALGVPGDKVFISTDGVYINDNLIPNTELVLKDPLFKKDISFNLKDNEYFMLSDYNKYSYDSRYFGIIRKDQILKEVIPLIVK